MTEDTAKWSITERVDLAAALARIESSLKHQDEHLDDLVNHAKMVGSRLSALEKEIEEQKARLYMHEKIVAAIVAAASLVAGAWKFFTGN